MKKINRREPKNTESFADSHSFYTELAALRACEYLSTAAAKQTGFIKEGMKKTLLSDVDNMTIRRFARLAFSLGYEVDFKLIPIKKKVYDSSSILNEKDFEKIMEEVKEAGLKGCSGYIGDE